MRTWKASLATTDLGETKRSSLLFSAGGISVCRAVAKGLALYKQVLIASLFGATRLADSFFVATAIPEMLLGILGINTFRGVATSVFAHLDAKGEQENMQRLFSSLFNFILILTGVAASLAVVFAPAIISILAPGFSLADREITAKIARIALPVLVFLGLANFVSSVLNAFHRFFVPALIQVVLNAVMIAFILVFHTRLGIYAVAWGFLFGHLASLVVQLPSLRRLKLGISTVFVPFDPLIRRSLLLALPLFVSMFAAQFSNFSVKFLGSFLSGGKIAALSYSGFLISAVIVLAAEPFLIVLMPRFANQVALGKLDTMRDELAKSVKIFVLLFFPLSVWFVLLSFPIVRLLFQRGVFTPEATTITSTVLAIFSLRLLPSVLSLLFVRVFLAIQKTVPVMWVNLFTSTVQILLNFILVDSLDVKGLAIANAAAALLQMLLFWRLVDSSIGFSSGKQFIPFFGKVILATFLLGMGVRFFLNFAGRISPLGTVTGSVLAVLGSLLFGLIIYSAASFALKIKESREVARSLRSITGVH